MFRFIDMTVLSALLGSTGEGAGVRFVHDFLRLWNLRVARLNAALERRDFEDADVVLLSIRSGSTMLGAPVLEAIAGMIQTRVRAKDVPDCLRHMPRLVEVGAGTMSELTAAVYYVSPRAAEAG